MKLITRIELGFVSDRELSALFASVSAQLVRTKTRSPERRNALATLENIQREQAARNTPKP